jgi:hypothetical protein
MASSPSNHLSSNEQYGKAEISEDSAMSPSSAADQITSEKESTSPAAATSEKVDKTKKAKEKQLDIVSHDWPSSLARL